MQVLFLFFSSAIVSFSVFVMTDVCIQDLADLIEGAADAQQLSVQAWIAVEYLSQT